MTHIVIFTDELRAELRRQAEVLRAFVAVGETVTWAYPRAGVDWPNFGFLTVWRDDGTYCDLRTDFVVPGM